jgi:hypothetical protein
LAKDKDWTLVLYTKFKNQGGNGTSILTSNGSARGTNTSARNTSLYSTRDAKNTALSRKCTFLLAYIEQATSFLAISTRNSLNITFRSKEIKGLVISMISLFLRGNIIVNTIPEYCI